MSELTVIVRETPLPANASDPVIQQEIANRLTSGALACHVETREDGTRWLITVSAGPQMVVRAVAAGKTPQQMFGEAVKQALATDPGEPARLGRLSQKYESNGNPAAVGFDDTGGHSYGLYQLASRKGAVAGFLKFLAVVEPEFARQLEAAGGDSGARDGTAAFKAAWSNLATNPAFNDLQHAYIKTLYYDVFVKTVEDQIGLAIDRRSLAVKNTAWSTAVQHGPHNTIFKNALGAGASGLDDAAIVARVYDERSNVDRYFASSTAAVKASVKNRFAEEKAAALAMQA